MASDVSPPGESAPPSDAPPARPASAPIAFDTRSVARSTVVVLSLVGAFLLIVWVFGVIGHFLFLLLLAWLFACALEPGVEWFVRRGRSRGLGAAITGTATILVALLLLIVFGDLLIRQVASLLKVLPEVIASVVDFVNRTVHTTLSAADIGDRLPLSPSRLGGDLESMPGGVMGIVGSMASVSIDTLTMLVFGFYMSAAGPKFLRAIARGLPPRQQEVFVTIADITRQKTGGYVVSKVILAGLSATFHGILFAAIGVPYWLPFALLVGITAQFVPLIGTYIGVLLPVIAVIPTAPWKAIVIIAFAIVYQQIESYVFTPRVSKSTMDVNPAIALAAVFIGGAIWGPIGLLIGIPLAAAGTSILDTYSRRYELVPALAARMSADPKRSGKAHAHHRHTGHRDGGSTAADGVDTAGSDG